jgi:hypothetical protein
MRPLDPAGRYGPHDEVMVSTLCPDSISGASLSSRLGLNPPLLAVAMGHPLAIPSIVAYDLRILWGKAPGVVPSSRMATNRAQRAVVAPQSAGSEGRP